MLASKCYRNTKNGVEYKSYRCTHKTMKICSYGHNVSEAKTKKYQLNTLEVFVQQEISRVEDEQAAPKRKKKTNVAK